MLGLLILVVLAGGLVAVQAAVNARLGRDVGSPLIAALISFLVGTLVLLLAVWAIRAPIPVASTIARIPWWGWLGGVFGAFFVSLVIQAVPRLGVAVTLSGVVAGQLAIATLLDHFGWLGVPVHRISLIRVAGILLLLAGVALTRLR